MFQDSAAWVMLYYPSFSLPLQQLSIHENQEEEYFLTTHSI